MADISLVADVQITASTVRPSTTSFGVPLIMTYHVVFPELYRVYSTLDEMADDGFTEIHTAYRMARKVFSQDLTVSSIVVGRLTGAAPAITSTILVNSVVEGDKFTLKSKAVTSGTLTDPLVTGGTISPTGAVAAGDEITITYTVQAAPTPSLVATALSNIITAIPGVDTSVSTATITVNSTAAGTLVPLYGMIATGTALTLTETTADINYDSAITTLDGVYSDWYLIMIDSGSAANNLAVAAAVEAMDNAKFFLAGTFDSVEYATPSPSDLSQGFDLEAAGYRRTALVFDLDAEDWTRAAWAGEELPKAPGTSTWSRKTLASVTPDGLTTSQITQLRNNNSNMYISVRGVGITHDGTVAMGEYIDTIIGIDALTADMETGILTLIAGADKVPYTPAGLVMVENVIKASCRRFSGTTQQPGLLVAGSEIVVMPEFSTINPADKAARRLMNVRFSATLAGAIHFVQVRGTVSV